MTPDPLPPVHYHVHQGAGSDDASLFVVRCFPWTAQMKHSEGLDVDGLPIFRGFATIDEAAAYAVHAHRDLSDPKIFDGEVYDREHHDKSHLWDGARFIQEKDPLKAIKPHPTYFTAEDAVRLREAIKTQVALLAMGREP
jgi:hypothetical protein